MYKQQSGAQNPVSTNGKNSPRVLSHPFTLIPFVFSNKKNIIILGYGEKSLKLLLRVSLKLVLLEKLSM